MISIVNLNNVMSNISKIISLNFNWSQFSDMSRIDLIHCRRESHWCELLNKIKTDQSNVALLQGQNYMNHSSINPQTSKYRYDSKLLEIQILSGDRHENVAGLNRLMGSPSSPLYLKTFRNWMMETNLRLQQQWSISN